MIFERTEGWPATMYLAGPGHLLDQPDVGAAVRSLPATTGSWSTTFRDEFLAATEAEGLNSWFAAQCWRSSPGPLCDAVLERSGSGQVLEELARSNALVIPLDRRGEDYHYHHLLARCSSPSFAGVDLAGITSLNARASHWWADSGDSDRAIEHAIAAADAEWAGELIWAAFPEVLARGRLRTLERWLAELGDKVIALSPELALSSAHRCVGTGEGDRAAHGRRLAAARAEDVRGGVELIQADLLLFNAIFEIEGMVQMGRDASRASELHPAESLGNHRASSSAASRAISPVIPNGRGRCSRRRRGAARWRCR